MHFQVIGLCLDVLGVILLALGGVFKVSGSFQFGPTPRDYKMLWLARIGLLLAIAGFGFQMYGVIHPGA